MVLDLRDFIVLRNTFHAAGLKFVITIPGC